MLPVDELIQHVKVWGYDLHVEYLKHKGIDTCWPNGFFGMWGGVSIWIEIETLPGNKYELRVFADQRQAATFNVERIGHGWRVWYYNHWGNWFSKRGTSFTKEHGDMIQWDVV